MIRLHALGLMLFLTSAQTAGAGAWLRDPGTGFLSTSGTLTEQKDVTGSLYGEYGLTESFTLGVDINGGMDRIGIPTGDGTIFLRFPLSQPETSTKWAAHVGLGARYEPMDLVPSVELGLSWGRGVQWGERFGWAAIDASVNAAKAPIKRIVKIDGTFGMSLGAMTHVMAQVFFTQTDGQTFTTLAPSLLYTPKESQTTYQIGAEFPREADQEPRIKIGIWREF